MVSILIPLQEFVAEGAAAAQFKGIVGMTCLDRYWCCFYIKTSNYVKDDIVSGVTVRRAGAESGSAEALWPWTG
jgi:hypothetical protein